MIKLLASSSVVNLYKAAAQFFLLIFFSSKIHPEDYAQILLIIPIVVFVLMIGDSGIGVPIIKSRNLSRENNSAIFVLCLSVALLFSIVFLSFFEITHRDVSGNVILFSAVIFFAVASVPLKSFLEKSGKYQQVTLVEFFSTTAGLSASLLCAKFYHPLLSIPIYYFSYQLLRFFFYILLCINKITYLFDFRGIFHVFKIGGWVFGFNFINYFARNADRYIVGFFFGPIFVSFYSISYQFLTIPLMIFTWPFSGILVSKLEGNLSKVDIAEKIGAIFYIVSMIVFPMVVFIGFNFDILRNRFMGEKWGGINYSVMLMCIVGGFQSVSSFLGVVLINLSKYKFQFLYGLFSGLLLIASLLLSAVIFNSYDAFINTFFFVSLVISLISLSLIAKNLNRDFFWIAKIISVQTLFGVFLVFLFYFAEKISIKFIFYFPAAIFCYMLVLYLSADKIKKSVSIIRGI